MLGAAKDLTAESISNALSAKTIENVLLERQANFIVHLINTNRLFGINLQSIIEDENKTQFSLASNLRDLMNETIRHATQLRKTYESGQF